MIAPGNTNMASVGDRNYPAYDVPKVVAYYKDKATKGKDTALRNLARKRIGYQAPTKPKSDFMPASVRNVTNKVDRTIGQANNVSGNVDKLLRTVSGKRIGLPGPIKSALRSVGF